MQPIIEGNAALLRQLREEFEEAVRHRADGPEAVERWEKALHALNTRYDELAFPGGLRAGLKKLEAGDMAAAEVAIRYLELRPFFFGAQYHRIRYSKILKRMALPARLKERFEATREQLRQWGARRR